MCARSLAQRQTFLADSEVHAQRPGVVGMVEYATPAARPGVLMLLPTVFSAPFEDCALPLPERTAPAWYRTMRRRPNHRRAVSAGVAGTGMADDRYESHDGRVAQGTAK